LEGSLKVEDFNDEYLNLARKASIKNSKVDLQRQASLGIGKASVGWVADADNGLSCS